MQQPSRPVTGPLVAVVADELARHAPFDRMDRAHLEQLTAQLSLVYFPPGAVVTAPEQGVPPYLYIVKQGAVAGYRPDQDDAEWPEWRCTAGECFPLGALMAGRAVSTISRAAGDTFCYRLPASGFSTLMAASPPFRDFATRLLARLLMDSRTAQRARSEGIAPQPLERPLGDLVPAGIPTCPPDATVRSVVQAMRDSRSGSALIIDQAGEALGIFTVDDVRDRIALEPERLDAPIADAMTPDPVCLPEGAMGFDAALVMAEHGFHHVVVTRDGRAAGVVSESELFAAQRAGVPAVSAAIRAAGDVPALQRAAGEVRSLTRGLGAEGLPAEQITRIVATLNDLITVRVIELEARAAGLARDGYCWLAFGSEGRHEQTFATDQDNGLLFRDPADGDAESVRQRLLPLAQRVNASLAACGFPLCKGEIMAGNPRWCLSLSEWKAAFAGWLRTPDGEALLRAAIFFDLRPLHGDIALAAELRDWLVPAARESAVFLRLMAENALTREPPLGLLKDFATADHDGHADTLDLKTEGAALFVDAARILALAIGDHHAGTAERLAAVAQVRGLDAAETEAWLQAFHFVQQIRLDHQLRCIDAGRPPDNFVAPDTLNALDRRILKEALRQARKLQGRLRLDYRL